MPIISHSEADAIDEALQQLQLGWPVAVPTETVYGLAADATNGEAVARIYEAKGRPSFNPLIAHVLDSVMASQYADIPPLAVELMTAFWPGPLTLVLPKRAECRIAGMVTAGLPTIALRAPDHPVARELIARFGRPLAAPSANRSGGISPTSAEHVAAGLGDRIALIINGGSCKVGLESTIVAVDGVQIHILRPGSITMDDLSAFGRVDMVQPSNGLPNAPGQLMSHYAPSKPLRLEAKHARDGEFHIGFGSIAGDYSLSASASLTEAAAHLFAALHAADASDRATIAAAPIPRDGLGLAINDRLMRAATCS